MTLLRRMERPRPPARSALPDAAPPAPPPSTPGAPVRELWRYAISSKVFAVAVTRDNRFLIAGSQGGDVLFFDMAGRLLWRAQVEGAINRLALAEDAECFVAGTVQNGQNATLWHYSGRLIRVFPTDGATWGVAITPDASLIVIGSLDNHLYGFDQDGSPLFKRAVGSPIRHVTVTADGSLIFLGADDHHVYVFDRGGALRWKFETGERVWAGVRVAEQARIAVVGSNDGHVYALDFDGHELWRYDTGGFVNALAVTPDGQFCAAGGSANTAYLLNRDGNALWEQPTDGHIYGLDLSPDGRFTLVGAHDHTIRLIDHQNNHRVWKEQTGGRVYGVALTPGGQRFAVASADQNVYAYRNLLAGPDAEALTRPDSRTHKRLVIQRVRDECAANPHAGLARWFGEMERSLRGEQFDVCRALLYEAHEDNGFSLSEGEQQYTRSLEGLYWLFRGVAHHRRGQYAEARECYETSKAIQERLNNRDGVGQVIAALSLLPSPDSDGPPLSGENGGGEHEIDLNLLDEIISKPRVLGTSETLLEYRLSHAPPAEQLRIILVAKEAGYLMPLLAALNAGERGIRAAASAALILLTPGPETDTLAAMLESPQTFARWQALRMLRERASRDPEQFKQVKARLWPLALVNDPAQVPDPLARREAIFLVRDAGSDADTPWLIARLNDPDPDVQLAAIEALGAVGDRRALPELDRVPSKPAFMGQNLKVAASAAGDSIEERHPLPTIKRVIFCQEDPLRRDAVQQSSLFLPGTEQVYCVVTVDHVRPGATVSARWKDGATVIHEERRALSDAANARIANVVETATVEDSPDRPPRLAARPRRHPILGHTASDDAARLSPLRRSPFARDDSDQESGLRRSPFERRPGSDGPPRPSFLDRPRPPGAAEARPSSRLGAAPRFRPAEGNAPAPSPFRSRFGGAPPGETGAPGRRPGGARPPAPPDPNENVAPSPTTSPAHDSGSDAPTPPRAASRPPAPPVRFDPGPDRPAREPSPPLPDWLLSELGETDDDDSPRPGPLGRRERSDPFGNNPFGRQPARVRSEAAQQIVFSLPRPDEGWRIATYELEVAIGDAATQQAHFKVIDTVALTGLEAGVAQPGFTPSHVFLEDTDTIGCLAHLEEAPVNTRLTGRVFSIATGALLAETTAHTARQGRQPVQLSWRNPGWPPGHYRVTAAVEHGNELHTEIELIAEIKAQDIRLCHQVDQANGSVGTNWPFYPGDTCYCVVDLGAPPPGVEISAAWYRKGQALETAPARPYVTTDQSDQRAAFLLTFRDKNEKLSPGHYSVVINGSRIVREERSFEVLPSPRVSVARRSAQIARERVVPFLRTHHLDKALQVMGLTALLALAFGLIDAALARALPGDLRSGDAILAIGHALGRVTQTWALGWLVAGAAYGALHTRHARRLNNAAQGKIYRAANLLLIFGSSALVWYQLSYLAFSAGREWPGAVWGLFDKLLWLNPVVAWFGPIVAVGITDWHRTRTANRPFHYGPAYAGIGLAAQMTAGWAGALIVGLPLGLAGAVVGSLLDVVGIDNALGYGALGIGAGVGFVVGPVAAGVAHYRDDLEALWNSWKSEKDQRGGAHYSLLRYLTEGDTVPLKSGDWLRIAYVALRVLIVMGAVAVALAILYRPVVLPVLEFVYHDHTVTSALSTRWIPASAGALLVAWPMLILDLNRRSLIPLLPPEQVAVARRFGRYAAALIALVPPTIAVASRTAVGRDLSTELAIFWANRIAALALLLCVVGWLAALVRHLPEPAKSQYKLDIALDEALMGLIVALAAIFLPAWMWALLLALALGLTSGGVTLLNRIR